MSDGTLLKSVAFVSPGTRAQSAGLQGLLAQAGYPPTIMLSGPKDIPFGEEFFPLHDKPHYPVERIAMFNTSTGSPERFAILAKYFAGRPIVDIIEDHHFADESQFLVGHSLRAIEMAKMYLDDNPAKKECLVILGHPLIMAYMAMYWALQMHANGFRIHRTPNLQTVAGGFHSLAQNEALCPGEAFHLKYTAGHDAEFMPVALISPP